MPLNKETKETKHDIETRKYFYLWQYKIEENEFWY